MRACVCVCLTIQVIAYCKMRWHHSAMENTAPPWQGGECAVRKDNSTHRISITSKDIILTFCAFPSNLT